MPSQERPAPLRGCRIYRAARSRRRQHRPELGMDARRPPIRAMPAPDAMPRFSCCLLQNGTSTFFLLAFPVRHLELAGTAGLRNLYGVLQGMNTLEVIWIVRVTRVRTPRERVTRADLGLVSFVLQRGKSVVGAQGRNRTTDTAIFSRMLYQLSYLGVLQERGQSPSSGRFIVGRERPVHPASREGCAGRGPAVYKVGQCRRGWRLALPELNKSLILLSILRHPPRRRGRG